MYVTTGTLRFTGPLTGSLSGDREALTEVLEFLCDAGNADQFVVLTEVDGLPLNRVIRFSADTEMEFCNAEDGEGSAVCETLYAVGGDGEDGVCGNCADARYARENPDD